MNLKVVFNLLLICCNAVGQGNSQHREFNKSNFYSILASASIADIDIQLGILKESFITEKEAYEGALLMKKAGLLKKPKDKISFFKTGRLKLESSIFRNNGNIEYHFLRLIIQEQAPKVVKYSNELKEDSILIRTNFNNFPPVLQQVILDYCKKSLILKIPS
jgi:hypothetical protein